ncbi:MAG: acyl-CoA dehydrogenase family protein, partial [Proteobacteria bacterium]|nr:acyl-CoA dehydrogenase family protein [Pseudomonadota bacterium]
MEDVASFRLRAREWLAAHMPPAEPGEAGWGLATDEEELRRVNRDRELQRRLFDGGLAGICFPVEYGGLGLSPAHQRAFDEEAEGYQMPFFFQVPTLGVCAATLLDFGSEEQKRRHIPAILRGEELWMQFLSEPTAGSDVASCLTTATRDGDEWVLDGSKVWTTGAWWADYALCLARTDWDVPKHRGLTVFIVKIHQPGIHIHRIEMINGSREFCQEYISGVRLSDSARVGPVGQGWSVTTGWLHRERESV